MNTLRLMYFGGGPWTEGRVFGFFTGFIDIPWLIVCFVLLLVDLTKKENKPLVLAWVLFFLVVFAALAILFLPGIISPPK